MTWKIPVSQRFYISKTVNAFGNWFTFLAISLKLNADQGTEYVVLNFLIQALPPLILAPHIPKLVPNEKSVSVYFLINILAAINVSLLLWNDSLFSILTFSLISSCLGTFANPLMNNVVGLYTARAVVENVHKNMAAINACALSLAPVIGGFVSETFGYSPLYLLDAFSFIAAGGIIFTLGFGRTESKEPSSAEKSLRMVNYFSFRKSPTDLKEPIFIFIGFLILGAVFNALEFGVFKHFSFDKDSVGLILGGWGFGNLMAMGINVQRFKILSTVFLSSAISTSFIVFCWTSQVWLAILIFVFCGFVNAALSGRIRGKIQIAIPEGVNSLSVWSSVQRYVALVNVVCYALTAVALHYFSFSVSRIFIVIAALVFLGILARNWQNSRKYSTNALGKY